MPKDVCTICQERSDKLGRSWARQSLYCKVCNLRERYIHLKELGYDVAPLQPTLNDIIAANVAKGGAQL